MDSPLLLAASVALVMTAQSLRAGRRRSALNEALHELRRPLQVLTLATPGVGLGASAAEWSLQMASAALTRLDREINGGSPSPSAAPVSVEPLVCAAAERWTARAALAGGSLDLRWMAAEAMVRGDRCELAQALDNLIANAIEHGGPAVVLEVTRSRRSVTLAVADSGAGGPRRSVRDRAGRIAGRLSGRNRHGHGLAVVHRTVAAHGGSFTLRRSPTRTVAAIELPLLGDGAGARA
ncbi:MAG TPA: HAMP domain-containing sensor histidine kinase [Solirubrobacterales bacterium]|jgi:signal transduction histidine kinase|nr:HAMP domain-containing sensor histidine kinase [Solirubrobacterales bacterium]